MSRGNYSGLTDKSHLSGLPKESFELRTLIDEYGAKEVHGIFASLSYFKMWSRSRRAYIFGSLGGGSEEMFEELSTAHRSGWD